MAYNDIIALFFAVYACTLMVEFHFVYYAQYVSFIPIMLMSLSLSDELFYGVT